MNYLNYDWLRANAKLIHYFGLGFIQVKVNDLERLHFYTPELPPITPEEDVHNHRYDFTSSILKGYLFQDLFWVTAGITHVLEQETCKEGVQATSSPKPCGLELTGNHAYATGSEYFISHNAFHRVKANYCITHIHRSDYKKELASVVRPIGQAKICPFSKKVEEEELWKIVEKMLKE